MSINIDNFLKIIDNITILELNELLNILEKKYSINLNNLDLNKNEVEVIEAGPKLYSLILTEIGDNKISVIKVIREVLDLSLKDAKNLVDKYPSVIKENIDMSLAENIKKKFEDAGAKIDIK